MWHGVRGILALVFFLLCPFEANGQDTTQQVALIITDCDTVSPSEVDRILRLEINSILSSRSISLRPTHLKISCMPNFLELESTDNTTGKIFTRRIPLDDKETPGMERVMAIAVTELMLSSWEQFVMEAKNGDASPMDSDPTEVKQSNDTHQREQLEEPNNNTIDADVEDDSMETSTKDEPGDKGLRLGALWRIYPGTIANLFGGELGGIFQLVGPLAIYVGIGAEGGAVSRPIGRAALFSAGGMLGVGIHGRLFSSTLRGTALLGFRGAFGTLNGKGESSLAKGYRVSGAVGGPLMRLSAASTTRPALGLSAEAGYTVFSIEGNVDGGPDIAMKGVWVAAMLDLWFYKKPQK